MLEELEADLDAAGVQLMLARVRPPVRDLLDRSGVTEAIGAENIFNRVLECVLVHLGRENVPADRLAGLSSDVMKRLQQLVNEMVNKTDGERRTELEGLYGQLGKAIGEVRRD